MQYCCNKRLGLEPYFKAVTVYFRRSWVSSGGSTPAASLGRQGVLWARARRRGEIPLPAAGLTRSLVQLAFSTSNNFWFLLFHSSHLPFPMVLADKEVTGILHTKVWMVHCWLSSWSISQATLHSKSGWWIQKYLRTTVTFLIWAHLRTSW